MKINISKLIQYMLLDEQSNLQFYGNMLMQMDFKESKKIKTAGVATKNGKISFYYNEEFIGKLTYPEMIYLTSHEILHLVLNHAKRAGGTFTTKDNIAMDLAVNSLLGKPPQGGCYPGQGIFEKLPLRKSYEKYFVMLPKDIEDKIPKGGGGDFPGDGEMGDWETHEMKSGDPISELAVNGAIKEAVNKSRGHMPGGLEEIINEKMKVKVNWKKQLKRFVGNFYAFGSTPSMKRMNRRIPLWGIVPGKKTDYLSKLLIGIDTSGSVSQKELSAFLTVISQMKIPMTMVQCDTEIKSVKRITNPYALINTKIVGRGGTDFQPVFDYAKKKHFDGVIYLTDMECPYPNGYRIKTLWVSTQKNYEKPPFGKVIVLKLKEEQ